jgi:hypothetical protein
MTAEDFSRTREFKYFLPAPAERISDQILYLTSGNVAGLFAS